MARLRYRLMFESLWSPEVVELSRSRIPRHLQGQERIDFYKQRNQAQELLTVLFPTDDEESDGN